ncbi:MAG TPA: diguanylate cyclase, partial [Longimicrobium sp.]|nr:diguanylate cyclase [Longimicrobium sp.]
MAGTLPHTNTVEPKDEQFAEIDELNRRAWTLRTHDPAEGVRLAEQAVAAARALAYTRGEAYALRNAAACRCVLLQHDAAMANLTDAMRMFGELGDIAGQASALSWTGNVHWRRAEYPLALRAQLDALAMQRAVGDHAGEGDTLNHLGNIYFHLSDFPRALEHYRASLALKEAQGDAFGVSQALNNIGNIYGSMGQYTAALDHHMRSLEIIRRLDDRVGEGIALSNLGASHEELGDYTLALDFYQQTLRLTELTGDLLARAGVLRAMGDAHTRRGDRAAALDFYRQSIAVALEVRNAYVEAEARIGLGQALAASGDPAAVDELTSALVLAERLESPRIAYEAHLALSNTYEAVGDHAAALEHFRAYHRVEDEVHGAEAARRIQALLAQAEVDRSQREAELLRTRNDALAAANEEKARLLEALRAQADELERLTREDALTGVCNRRQLDALLALEWERARRFGRHLTAAMVDVDHFKAVNDGWSHATGDAVLRQVAAILRDGTRAVDVVGRYGGEEFVLLLVETAPGPAASHCEKLRAALEAHDWPSIAPGLRVTASFGVADNAEAGDPDGLLAAADARLYAA